MNVGIAGGTLGVQTAMNNVVVHEKIVNMVQVSLIIFILSALVLRSLVGAAFVLTPLAIAVIANLGVMGWSQTWPCPLQSRRGRSADRPWARTVAPSPR